MQDTMLFVLDMMIAFGAATPGELPGELYYEDFTSATREFCYPCWTFTVKLNNF